MFQSANGHFASALRVIGQDLADLIPENLVIEYDGATFTVDGMCSRSRLEAQENACELTGLRKFSAKLRAGLFRSAESQLDLDRAPFQRLYQPSDIERLDRQANRQRRGSGGVPEIYSLGERLRTIGKVVDGENGRLVRIFKSLHQIVFDFVDAHGVTQKRELDNTELYRLQRSYTSERTDVRVSSVA